MPDSLVHSFLEESAQKRPEAVLVVETTGERTYGQVEAQANRIARALLDQGARPGDRIALLCANSAEYIEAYYGILKTGAIVVSLNAQARPENLIEMLEDCGPVGLVCGRRQLRGALSLIGKVALDFMLALDAKIPDKAVDPSSPTRSLSGPVVLPAMSSEPPNVEMRDSARAAIIYTSGSTGKPRGAILRHSNLIANTHSIVEYLSLSSSERVMVVLPFHYVYGKSLLNTHVSVGGSVVIENRFMYPQEALNALEQTECTGFAGVPSTFAILLNKSNMAARELPSLRYVTQAGGPMSPRMQRALIEALPGKQIFIMYGATEASARLSYLDPADLPRKIGSIGKAIPGVELKVLRKDGTEADVDEPGELVARGANIMEGYWNAPEETAAVLDQRGYHTGDLAKRDAEGFLYVVGRIREMIKSGAHRISPLEIQNVLLHHPAIHEAAVLGHPDETLGEKIGAYVVLHQEADPVADEEILDWCRSHLPAYKVPHALRILDELPHHSSGKIDKLALKRQVQPPA